MNSRQIEQIAVGAVKDIFLKNGLFNPCISENDREPIWDGFIYLQSKNQSTIRIAVQVKGKTIKNIPSTPSYPIRLTDLHAYKRDGGILYFVVYITKTGNFVYIAKLAPIDLRRYIQKANNQNKISVRLSPFNPDIASLENDLRDFHRDCKKQISFTDKEILSLEEASKHGYKITATISGCKTKEEALFKLTNQPVYLYAETGDNGFSTEYPIGEQQYSVYRGTHVNEDIKVAGKVYYTEYDIYRNKDTEIVNIGNFLTIGINNRKVNFIKFDSKNYNISTRLHELVFLLECIKTKVICYGGNKVQVKSIPSSDYKEIEEEYKKWHRAKMLYKLMGVTEDVNIGDLSDEDAVCLDLLGQAIIDKKPISQDHELNPITTATIGKYHFLLFATKLSNGKYKVEEFFKHAETLVFAYENSNGDKLISSPFTPIFSNKDFTNVNNIDYSKIISSYEFASQYNPDIYNRATNDLLMALNTYDGLATKNPMLLGAVKSLSKWILDKATKHKICHIINFHQIIKRERNFTSEEKDLLVELLESPDITNEEKTAIHLLLENKTMAEIYFKKLSKEQQKLFTSLPISFFMNELC